MKLVVFSVPTVAMLLLAAFAAHASDAERQKLQGRWNVESFDFNGEPVESMKGGVREFNGDKYSLTPPAGETYSGTYQLDASHTPKHIDLQLPDRTLQGIYEIDGDTLRLAYALEGDQRPAEFASKPGSGVVLAVHQRAKN